MSEDSHKSEVPSTPLLKYQTMSLEELQSFAAELGLWAQYSSPFHPGANHCLGFTPHSVTGWNGRPDHAFNFVDLAEMRSQAEEFLRSYDPEPTS